MNQPGCFRDAANDGNYWYLRRIRFAAF
jgi:hypothetical protein